MFTLSKINPELTIGADTHKDLGRKLKDLGGRILLICSLAPEDRESIIKVKSQLTANKLTFIQYDLNGNFVNKDNLDKLQERAENFNVSTVVSVGDLPQRMSGRFVSQQLSLNYFELPTLPNYSYLLIPKSIFSNRIGNDYDIQFLSTDRINSINIDLSLLRDCDDKAKSIEALTILFNLAQLFTNSNNNFISITESRNLFERILIDLENDNINLENLIRYSLTAAMLHGASSDIELNLTIYSWISSYRFNFNSNIACAKILPCLLDEFNENDLAIRIRELHTKLSISSRLTDLGFTPDQLLDILKNRPEIKSIIEKAF